MDYLHRAWAEIDLDALENNYNIIRGRLKRETKVLCVIKADAYGHGADSLAKEYERLGCDWFAVSNVEEALRLRARRPDVTVEAAVPCRDQAARWAAAQRARYRYALLPPGPQSPGRSFPALPGQRASAFSRALRHGARAQSHARMSFPGWPCRPSDSVLSALISSAVSFLFSYRYVLRLAGGYISTTL